MTTPKLNTFTQAYIECALWSSTAHGSPDEAIADPPDETGQHRGTFDRSFMDCNYDRDDLSPELLAHVIEDCANFQRDHAELLAEAYEQYMTLPEWTANEYAGHDFWLTRNGHGAGFWDRGLGDVGQQLTDAAHAYGTEDWTVVRREDDPNDYGTIVLG